MGVGSISQDLGANIWLPLRIRELITPAISYILPVNIYFFFLRLTIKYFRHAVLGGPVRCPHCSSPPSTHVFV